MQWIAMYEGFFNHPKTRRLKKVLGCSGHEVAGIMYNLWSWSLQNADPEGKIVFADKNDLAGVLYAQLSKDLSPEDVVQALIDTEWIDEHNDELYIHDWTEWQQPWIKLKAAREKDAQRKRNERMKKKLSAEPKIPKLEKAQEPDLPEPRLLIPKEPKVKGAKTQENYSEDFEEFWKAYPRKVGKGEAYQKYQTRVKSGWTPEELLSAAKNYAADVKKKKTEETYIKHGKTFLSDKTPFVDYLNFDKETAPTLNEDDPFGDWR